MTSALLAALLGLTPATAQVSNPDTYTYLTISDADSMDPAWSYDTASESAVLNVYETLIAFDGSSTERFVPRLATAVPSRANGLISKNGRVYTFPIRKGVRFHDGAPMTPEDVRYSLMRFMLYDRDAGPSSLLLQPLLGAASTRDAKGQLKAQAFQDASKAVQVKGDAVVVTLPRPYAPLLGILAAWAPVVSRTWAAQNGGWDGEEATWAKFNNPKKESSPFFERANGTGPFKLDRWDRRNREIVLARNDAYWRASSKLKRVVIKGVNEFGTRKLMLAAGDADSIYATAPEYNQLKGIPGVRIMENQLTVEMNPVVYFTFHVNAVGNGNIGSGRLDGGGVPPDFFADLDVRRGFAYAFDYAGYLRDVERGMGTQARGCVPKSLPGYSASQPLYTFDPKKAEEHFRRAFGGKLWETGFSFTLAYNSGNVERETIAQMLKRSVESLNPRFRIDVRPIEWPTFLDNYQSSKLPIFIMGWQADFPDPHNFAFPLMHSQGNFPATQHYANPAADRLVEAALAEQDPVRRKALYVELQAVEHADVPHLVVVDALRYRPQRDWVRGWVSNPVFPDAPWGSDFYPMYKAEAPR